MAGVKAVLVLMTLALAVSACGKKGPPQPAGPAEKVIWPHAYPTPRPSP